MTRSSISSVLAFLLLSVTPAAAQGPLHVDITEGVASPLPIAIAEVASGPMPGHAGGDDLGIALSRIMRDDLLSTALYRLVPAAGNISGEQDVDFAPFMRSGAQALIVGRAQMRESGQLSYHCTLYDVFGRRVEASSQILVATDEWRRAAHQCADMVFQTTTGDPGHFDTRLLFIAQGEAASGRGSRLGMSDYDGANVHMLSTGRETIAMPAFAPDGARAVYMSYAEPEPELVVMEIASGRLISLPLPPGIPSAPRFSPSGTSIIFSLVRDGHANICTIDIATGSIRQLTDSIGADTSPSYSPDGSLIVFESDRSGQQQLYVMDTDGNRQRRISFGEGAYASPVWSPRDDLIAFTQISGGRLRIGIMNSNGSNQRIITDGVLDEDPSWAVSGRALAFQRRSAAQHLPSIWMTDLTGKVQHAVRTGTTASDPAWSWRRP